MVGRAILFLIACAGLLLTSCSKDSPTAAGSGAPAITTQPAAQTVNEGSSVSLTVVATGNPAPTYQWQKNDTNITGATSATYTIASATAAHSGTYRVTVTNSAGSVTSNAVILTVNPTSPAAPVIVTQPQSVTVDEGRSATFTVVATGNPTPTYQWRKNGANISGATSATYTIASVAQASAGIYSVLISNAQGNVTSGGAALTVNRGPEVMTYTVTNDTMHIVSPTRINSNTQCNGDTLVTRYDTSEGSVMNIKFSVSGNTMNLYMDTIPATLRRIGSGTGLIGSWTPNDTAMDMPDTLVFSATTLTAYGGGGNGNSCPADNYIQYSSDTAYFNGTAVQLSCTQVRLTGNVTSEQVTITWDTNGNMIYTSTNTARTPYTWYQNPTSCPNNWTPDWFYSNDGFKTLNHK